jgi:hypothetical protein
MGNSNRLAWVDQAVAGTGFTSVVPQSDFTLDLTEQLKHIFQEGFRRNMSTQSPKRYLHLTSWFNGSKIRKTIVGWMGASFVYFVLASAILLSPGGSHEGSGAYGAGMLLVFIWVLGFIGTVIAAIVLGRKSGFGRIPVQMILVPFPFALVMVVLAIASGIVTNLFR